MLCKVKINRTNILKEFMKVLFKMSIFWCIQNLNPKHTKVTIFIVKRHLRFTNIIFLMCGYISNDVAHITTSHHHISPTISNILHLPSNTSKVPPSISGVSSLLCVYTTHWLTSNFWNADTTIRYCIHCFRSYLPRSAWIIEHVSFNCAINFVFTCCISHFQGWGLCFSRHHHCRSHLCQPFYNKEINSYPLIIFFGLFTQAS